MQHTMNNNLSMRVTRGCRSRSQQHALWIRISFAALLVMIVSIATTGCTRAQAGPFGGDKWDYLQF
jgi:hypothetical protein